MPPDDLEQLISTASRFDSYIATAELEEQRNALLDRDFDGDPV
jgi:hypothetical protein